METKINATITDFQQYAVKIVGQEDQTVANAVRALMSELRALTGISAAGKHAGILAAHKAQFAAQFAQA